MIYLIGGAPRSGKSILAKRLSEKLKIPHISTDDLEGEVRDKTPQDEWQVKFPKTILRKEADGSNDEMYSKFSVGEIVEAYIQQSKAVWDEINKLAQKEDHIVEGYHIHPELVVRLRKEIGVENVKSVFLIRNDADKAIEEATKFASEDDWFTRDTKDKATYAKMAEMINKFSEFFEEEGNKNQLRVISMDNNFENGIEEGLDHLSS